jgi:hypothetical protein
MKLKFTFFVLSFVAVLNQANSQNVGINATGAAPANCAMLDIAATDKGLLVPRVALTAVGTYAPLTGTSVNGLLVYSTSSPTGGNGTGYYYWTGAQWANLIDNVTPGNPWYLNGNTSNTTPAAPATYGTSTIGASENYLGTTDANDIVFGTNNIERMRVKLTTGRIGIGTAAPNSLTHITGTSTSRILNVANTGGGDVIDASNIGGTIAVGYAGLFSDVFPSVAGTGYSIIEANASTQSQMSSGGTLKSYSFGVFGNVFTTTGAPKRVGGVIGTGIYVNQWGSFGYVTNASTIASLYYTNANGAFTGAGGRYSAPNSSLPLVGIGMIGNSDAFGVITNGGKGGLFVYGEKIGSFTDGVVYTNNMSVQLNTVNETKIPTFSSTSTSVDIQSHGQAKLINGRARVNFTEAFASTTSKKILSNVTITALGKSNGLYVESIDDTGFDVSENNNGTSNLSFNWLAIGIKRGFEEPELNDDVLKIDFESNMKQVANNEGDPNSEGKPLWWDGKSFRFDTAPPAGARPYAVGKKNEEIKDKKVSTSSE